jgi:hypothetical protein
MRWAGHAASMEENKSAYKVFVREPAGKRPLRKPRRRWENINMDLREIRCERVDWIRPVGCSCEDDDEPSGSINFWEFLQ